MSTEPSTASAASANQILPMPRPPNVTDQHLPSLKSPRSPKRTKCPTRLPHGHTGIHNPTPKKASGTLAQR
jgi:hypothetical protein